MTPAHAAPAAAGFPSLRLVDHPVVRDRLAQLRDARTPREGFRRALAELSLVLCAEAMRDLPLAAGTVTTPNGVAETARVDAGRALAVVVLRAGLGMLGAVTELLPGIPVGHIGLRREDGGRRVAQYFAKLPTDPGGPVFLADPMIATGRSAQRALDVVSAAGIADERIRFLAVLVTPEGLGRLRAGHPGVTVFAAALDPELNAANEIVPGIGDAGDRLFGTQR